MQHLQKESLEGLGEIARLRQSLEETAQQRGATEQEKAELGAQYVTFPFLSHTFCALRDRPLLYLALARVIWGYIKILCDASCF